MASPTWQAAADTDPALESKPVGTGPFVFKDYKPGESFTATKNPNYWNKPYPYLDEVEFRVIPDALTRCLRARGRRRRPDPHDERRHDQEVPRRAGQLPDDRVDQVRRDGLHAPARHAGGLTAHRLRACAARWPTPPTTRRSSTRSTPASRRSPTGRSRPASSATRRRTGSRSSRTWPRRKSSSRPTRRTIPARSNINLSTTQDATNLIIAQAQQQFFTEAGFDDVQISQIEQAKYILTALQGHFQAFQWRNHGGVDLDAQYIWWHSSNALPVDQLALNFGRIKDPVIDQALDTNRGETDPAKKKELAETVDKQFATECYNLWGSYTVWGLAHTPKVQGLEDFIAPSGENICLCNGIQGVSSTSTRSGSSSTRANACRARAGPRSWSCRGARIGVTSADNQSSKANKGEVCVDRPEDPAEPSSASPRRCWRSAWSQRHAAVTTAAVAAARQPAEGPARPRRGGAATTAASTENR